MRPGFCGAGAAPRVEDWFSRIKAMPNFTTSFIDWVPDHLTNDLRDNGAKSWPEVAKILDIAI